MKKMIYQKTTKNQVEKKNISFSYNCESGKKCMKCNCACWRSDVNYCWPCYKYEMFESR